MCQWCSAAHASGARNSQAYALQCWEKIDEFSHEWQRPMNFTSSRSSKNTPASLRKELRHLSRELPSSDIPKVLSSRKSQAIRKETDKENSRFSEKRLKDNEWMNGGAVVSPAVFSFSSSSTPPKSEFNVASEDVSFDVTCRSVAQTSSVQNGSVCPTMLSNTWVPGSSIPRGLMVSFRSDDDT